MSTRRLITLVLSCTVLLPCALLLSCAILGLSACGRSNEADARPNVLLVTLDTVRADRIGCYGHEVARTPNLDALALRGVRFERAYAAVPYTLPAHATLLTGVYPSGHGLHVNFQGSLPPAVGTLAEAYKEAGYRTAGFVATGVLDRRFGLGRGFDRYDDLSDRSISASTQVERPGGEVTRSAVAWLEEPSSRPFFAWVHYYDAHDPYLPPAGFQDFEDPYDGEISFVDAQVGALLATLEQAGKLADTWIVVVADHGDAFGGAEDHGELGHGLLVYDSTMRVPMIIAGPDPIAAGTTVVEAVGQVDVAPTLLAILGGAPPEGLEGQSLLPVLRGEALPARPVLIESEHPLRAFAWAPLYGVVHDGWKYIHAPTEELYDLRRDPGEAHNLAEDQADVRASLSTALGRLRESNAQRAAGAVQLGAGTRDVISKLGYTEGSEVPSPTSLEGLKDPKDMVHVAAGAARARVLLRTSRFVELLELVNQLIEQSPESDELWVLRGSGELGLNRPEAAVASFEQSLRRAPDNTLRLLRLGDALVAAGRRDEGLARYRRALEVDPGDGQSYGRLGIFYAQEGDFERAVEALERFIELDPTSPNAHTNLANALFAQGQFGVGIEHLRTALRLDAECVQAYRSLYKVHRMRGERAAAIETLRAGAAALPSDPYFRHRLAWELATAAAAGEAETQEAVGLARGCAADQPRDPVVLDVLAVALARRGEFADAITTGEVALEGARARGDAALAALIETQLELFRSGRPYVE